MKHRNYLYIISLLKKEFYNIINKRGGIMKLNNKGWGLTEMIFICCGVLICLMIVIYYVNRLEYGINKNNNTYENNDSETISEPDPIVDDSNKYNDYFIECQDAAIDYVKGLNIEEEVKTLSLPLTTLIENNYVEILEDCTGNILINKENDVYTATAAISCSNYEE